MSNHTPWTQEQAEKWAKEKFVSLAMREAFLAGMAKAAEMIEACETQKLVIEKLREQRNWALTELGEYPEQAIANDDAEIAAIGTQFEEEK